MAFYLRPIRNSHSGRRSTSPPPPRDRWLREAAGLNPAAFIFMTESLTACCDNPRPPAGAVPFSVHAFPSTCAHSGCGRTVGRQVLAALLHGPSAVTGAKFQGA